MQAPCYVEIIGGLGNQLFQVATAYAHCKRNNYSILIREKPNCDRPSYWNSWLHAFKDNIGTHVSDGSVWREPSYNYTPIPSSCRNLYGYFQTWKYFEDYKEELLSILTLPQTLQDECYAKYGHLINNENNCIIHVRRTDYFQGNNTGYHGILDESYFKKACAMMREKNKDIQFYILSDDIAWCREQACFTGYTCIDELNESIALWLMTKTPNIIMSNSTFSWWGAWLNPDSKHVIAPAKWHGPRGPQNDHDLYYPSWNKLPTIDCFVHLIGGLCNQLFQVAAGYSHCKRNGYRLRISSSVDYRPAYWGSWLHKFIEHASARQSFTPLWNEPHFHYVPIPYNIRELHGFFQSSKYFADVSHDIRNLFDIPLVIKNTIQEKYSTLLTSENLEHATVVHVRRGDYLMGGNLAKHGILTEKYYEAAVSAMRTLNPDGPLLVFSDDLSWCRAQPYFADATFVDEPHDVKALWVMSRFRHYIMSNSTFSWWAVWLGAPWGHVIAPDRWFGATGPQDWQDVYEPDWIRVRAE